MNKDRSLEEVDLVKLLLYTLIFVIVCIIMIVVFLIPSIKEYKNAKLQNSDKAVNLAKIEQVYKTHYDNLQSLKTISKKPLDAINHHFSEIKFVAQTGKFFSDVKLNKLPKIDEKENFLRYELNVTGLMKSPQNLYDFLDFVNDYESIVRVDFPISMKSNGEKIDTSFKIKVYTSLEDQEALPAQK